MNRRGFIALATAAAVVPQELIPAPVVRQTWEARTLGPALTATTTKAARFVVPSAFLMQLQEILNEEFSGLYECIPYESVFEDPEA